MPKNSRRKLIIFAALFLAVAVVILKLFLPLASAGKAVLADQTLKNDNGRTNILLLGIGDAGHDGPNLTDSMIVLSLQPKTHQATLISLPRDIYLDSLQSKINAAYAFGQDQNPPMGLAMAKAAATEVTGLPIHYAIRGNFSVFREIVDLVGGIDVTVAHPLDDYLYPIDGKENDSCGFSPEQAASLAATIVDDASAATAFPCRYEHLHFDPGFQHMDGATALKFVRSRHAVGDEGSDFARAARQQLVLEALKNKIFSTDTLLNPAKILTIYNQVKTDIDTDIAPSEIGAFLKVTLQYRGVAIKSVVLDETYLINPPVDYRGWILLPTSGNWDAVHQFIQSQLASPSASLQ
ncbi:MAG: LCP family protein [Patescibacteria group bacterium]|nr:LCP family protein [Patescibacteria group bacterium]